MSRTEAHEWERFDAFFSRCAKCGWGWKVDADNDFPCPGVKPPTPEELIEARRVVRRLHRFVGSGAVRDMAGTEMWDSLVEGGRAIAVTTAYLGQAIDPIYAEAWEQMMKGDEE
jgi:hypothetical protein